jgi:anaerobic ribonucleoside-triphosphate reductase
MLSKIIQLNLTEGEFTIVRIAVARILYEDGIDKNSLKTLIEKFVVTLKEATASVRQ